MSNLYLNCQQESGFFGYRLDPEWTDVMRSMGLVSNEYYDWRDDFRQTEDRAYGLSVGCMEEAVRADVKDRYDLDNDDIIDHMECERAGLDWNSYQLGKKRFEAVQGSTDEAPVDGNVIESVHKACSDPRMDAVGSIERLDEILNKELTMADWPEVAQELEALRHSIELVGNIDFEPHDEYKSDMGYLVTRFEDYQRSIMERLPKPREEYKVALMMPGLGFPGTDEIIPHRPETYFTSEPLDYDEIKQLFPVSMGALERILNIFDKTDCCKDDLLRRLTPFASCDYVETVRWTLSYRKFTGDL